MRSSRGFVALIGLIAATFVWGMSASGTALATFGLVVLASATLVGAVWLSGSAERTVLVWAAICGLAVVSTGAALLGDAEGTRPAASLVLVAVVTVAPASLIRALARQPVVNRQTVGAVIALYLLLGLFFATVYGAIDAIAACDFFTTVDGAQYSDLPTSAT